MSIKISQKTLKFLRDIITGDKELSPYKTGSELVEFFNSFGFADTYGQGFPSRRSYVETKLIELNNGGRINKVFETYFSPINFVEEETKLDALIDKMNKYLEFDGYKLVNKGKEVKIVPIFEKVIMTQDIYKFDSETIRENIEKCDKKIEESDFTGAITNARSFLESLLLYIYQDIKKEKYNFTGDLPRLYKDVSRLLKLNIEENTEDDIKKVLGGLTSIISGISGISNKMADRHGRLIEYDKKKLKDYATLAVNSAKTLSIYIYSCYEKLINNHALRNF